MKCKLFTQESLNRHLWRQIIELLNLTNALDLIIINDKLYADARLLWYKSDPISKKIGVYVKHIQCSVSKYN